MVRLNVLGSVLRGIRQEQLCSRLEPAPRNRSACRRLLLRCLQMQRRKLLSSAISLGTYVRSGIVQTYGR
jgi:hypothetical protein